MTIHSQHPFLDPNRDPGRQLRGRLGSRVSLLTAGSLHDRSAAGLTVSSLLVAAGELWRIIVLLDPAADLTDALEQTGAGVVSLLDWPHRQLAEVFAGLAPAPGGAFTTADFEQTSWGPRLASAATWAGVRVESSVEVGWSLQVTAVIEQIALGNDEAALHHRRGRYVVVE